MDPRLEGDISEEVKEGPQKGVAVAVAEAEVEVGPGTMDLTLGVEAGRRSGA